MAIGNTIHFLLLVSVYSNKGRYIDPSDSHSSIELLSCFILSADQYTSNLAAKLLVRMICALRLGFWLCNCSISDWFGFEKKKD